MHTYACKPRNPKPNKLNLTHVMCRQNTNMRPSASVITRRPSLVGPSCSVMSGSERQVNNEHRGYGGGVLMCSGVIYKYLGTRSNNRAGLLTCESKRFVFFTCLYACVEERTYEHKENNKNSRQGVLIV